MKKCLIVTDYQYDFVADDGLLTAGKPAQLIEDYIYKLTENYIKNNCAIYFLFDTHISENWNSHPESNTFKIHCEKNTRGWELYGKLNKYMNYKSDNIKFIEKSAYCPNFETLNEIIKNFDEITLVGVVTDICVFQTAVGLYTVKVNEGYNNKKIIVAEKGCASFNKQSHDSFIEYMKNIMGLSIV